jgi:uncharacterized membrane protein YciS (DUF1049 family)
MGINNQLETYVATLFVVGYVCETKIINACERVMLKLRVWE